MTAQRMASRVAVGDVIVFERRRWRVEASTPVVRFAAGRGSTTLTGLDLVPARKAGGARRRVSFDPCSFVSVAS